MKIHYNFILYLADTPELEQKFEIADYIFSGSKQVLEEVVRKAKGGLLYTGEWRTGTLSRNGRRLLAAEGVSLDDIEDGFMQVQNIFPYLEK